MKSWIILLPITLFVSIATKTIINPENPISPEAQKTRETDTIKRYLSSQNIYTYLKQSPAIEFTKQFPMPFDSIQFDKVIAYDFDGRNERIPSVIDRQGLFVNVVTNQQALTHNQVERFINFITSEESYGETTAACFDPGWALVFFNANKVVFVVDICLDCNYLHSTKPVPATSMHDEQFEDYTLPRHGFSKKARSSIRGLAKELNMKYGDANDESIYD